MKTYTVMYVFIGPDPHEHQKGRVNLKTKLETNTTL